MLLGRHILEILYVILGLKLSLGKFLRTGQIRSDGTDQIGDFEKCFFSFWKKLVLPNICPICPICPIPLFVILFLVLSSFEREFVYIYVGQMIGQMRDRWICDMIWGLEDGVPLIGFL